MKTLLTGFNRFGQIESNPSQLIVEHLAQRPFVDLITKVLPTEFVQAGERIVDLIRQTRPDRVICLGVGSPGPIRLERITLNLDDTEKPDNTGTARQGKTIIPDGPLAYASTLPIEEMRAALQQRGIPALISNHAGTFVCNHVFYVARHEIERLGTGVPCGFIHVPPLGDNQIPLSMMLEAVECCLQLPPS